MDRFDVTLAQAGVLAEFDDDPAAVEKLAKVARSEYGDPDGYSPYGCRTGLMT